MTAIHSATQEELNCFRAEARIRGGMEVRANNRHGERDGDVAFLSQVMGKDPEFPYSKIAVDIQICCPTSASVGRGQAGAVNNNSTQPTLDYSKKNKLLAGNAGFKSKMNNKTIERCNSAGFDFLGISFETTGSIHPAAYKFISRLADRASECPSHWGFRKPKLILGNWLNRLSFAIRKSHADAILDRLTALDAFAAGRFFAPESREARFARCIEKL